jgi:hypothetical protein
VAESAFTQAFLRRAIEIEKTASATELELLDKTLAYILEDPCLPGRFPLFMILYIQLSLSEPAHSLSSLL